MKSRFVQNEFGQAGFQASTEEQDGSPHVSWLFTDLAPTWFSGPRRALGCSLPFLSFVSGKLSVDTKMTPLTASLVRELLPPGEVFIDSQNIEFKPTDIQKGGSTLHVKSVETLKEAEEFIKNSLESDNGIRQTAVAILKNDGVRGYISNPQYRIVSSNLWLLNHLSSERESFYHLCSLALMYSEDLAAGRVIIHGMPSVPENELVKLVQAFYSVGISLEVR